MFSNFPNLTVHRLKIAIILQLTGALDTLAGVLFIVLLAKVLWVQGCVLLAIGLALFGMGRWLLAQDVRSRKEAFIQKLRLPSEEDYLEPAPLHR